MHSHKKKMHPTEWESSRKQYEERFIKSTAKNWEQSLLILKNPFEPFLEN